MAQRVEDSGAPAPSPASKRAGAIETLSTLLIPNFRYLIVGNAFSMLGFQARMMAQAWLVLELTDSDGWVGAANGVPAIPVIAFALFGGVFADRMNRTKLLVYTRLIFAGLGLVTAVLISTGTVQLWHIFVLAALIGVVQTTGVTASQTLIVDIVGRGRLFSANAMFGVSFNLAMFVGPAFGGLLISEFGVDAAFYMVAGMLTVSAVVVSLIRAETHQRVGPAKSVMADLREGIGYIWAKPELRWLLLLGVMLIFAAMHTPLLARYSRDVLGEGARGLGVLLAAQGVGGALGTLTLIASGNVQQLARVLVVVNIAFLGFMILLASSTVLWISSIAMFGTGFLIVWWGDSMRTMFHLSELIGMRPTMMTGIGISAAIYVIAYMRSRELRTVGRVAAT